jgi:ectoine hydroxylase-related dioxygenase (phytanoyl-CoA dioxygenase family)
VRGATDHRLRHPDQVSATGRAGDVLVFSSHLWHSGTANESGRPAYASLIGLGRVRIKADVRAKVGSSTDQQSGDLW